MDKRQKKQMGFSVTYLLIGLVALWLFQTLIVRPLIMQQIEVPYSQFRQDIEQGKVETLRRLRLAPTESDVTSAPGQPAVKCARPSPAPLPALATIIEPATSSAARASFSTGVPVS